MKVLFLNPIAELGGAERMLLDVMASLRDANRDIEMHLITLADGPLSGAAKTLGVRGQVVPMPPMLARLGDSGLKEKNGRASLLAKSLIASPRFIGYVRTLRHAVGSVAPDIVHSNGIKTHLLSRFVTPPSAKLLWHVHDFIGDRPMVAKLLRHFAGRTDGAIAISEAVAMDLRGVLPRARVKTVLNGINVDHFSPGDGDGASLDHAAGFETARDGTVRIGLLATYARWKGHDVFIDAAKRLIDCSPSANVRFYLIGGPIYATAGSQFSRAELSQRVRALGLERQVGFVDFQADPGDAYRALDVVVHASTRPEPFGRTIAEAMACGRALIVASAGGARNLFTEGVDALGHPPGDATALADAMMRFVEDAALRRLLGDAARRTAAERFDRRRLGVEIPAVYDTVIR